MITIPDSSEGLQDLLNDAGKMKEIYNEGKLGEVVTKYGQSVLNKDKQLGEQIKQQVESTMADFINENREAGFAPVNLTNGSKETRSKAMQLRNGKGAKYSNRAPGAALDRANIFDDPTDYFQATWDRANTMPNAADLNGKLDKLRTIQNAFGSIIPSDGGFLIPETLRSQLLQLALEDAVVRPRATVIPMDSLRVPIPMIDTTTNAGSLFGGIVTYWEEEGAQLTASSAKFGRVVLDAKKLTAYSDVPSELMQDAPAFEGFFAQKFPQAIAFQEDQAFFTGTGVGQPLGFRGSSALVSVDPTTSNSVSWADITTMYSRMLPTSQKNAVWICSPDVFPSLAQMTFGTGQFPVFVSIGGGSSDSVAGTILGRPLIVSEKNPALGSDGALSFVDLSYYLIGDRQSMTVSSSTDYKFGQDLVSFRIIERVDGRPWIQSAITPANGSTNTLSPFVQLSATHT